MILWTLRIDRWCDPFEEDQPDVVSGVHVVLCKRVGQIREKEKERERESMHYRNQECLRMA